MNSKLRALATGLAAALTILPLTLAPPAVAAAAPGHSGSLIVKFRGKQSFHRSATGALHSRTPALDALLERAGVVGAVPLFRPEGADLELRERLGMDRFFLVRLDRPDRVPEAVAEFSRHPDVDVAVPDHEGELAGSAAPAAVIPNDTHFDRQWPFLNTGSNPSYQLGTPGADIKATEAWTITTGSPDIIVAVLDTGILYDHPDFAGRIWTNAGEIPGNSVDDDANGFIDDVYGWNFAYGNNNVLDDQGHGTAVSSVFGAATNNSTGYAGLDWHCRIMSLKTFNSVPYGYHSWWIQGVYYAANNGARVLSMSFATYFHDPAFEVAIQYAHARGCVMAGSMGNSSAEDRLYPAAYEDVLGVGATNAMDRRASFSTYGDHIDVAAPGVLVPVIGYADPPSYGFGSGTSFSAPMVAGLAALLLAQDPTRTPDQVSNIIRGTADDLVGLPGEDTPGHDIYYGFGRINAYRALTGQGSTAPPAITAPSSQAAAEGTALAVNVSVGDADGNAIRSLEADLSTLPLGHDAVFQTSPDLTQGTLTWTPGYRDAGLYLVRFSATDPLRSVVTTEIDVAEVNDPPEISAPLFESGIEGSALAIPVSATDPDGDPVTAFEASELPPGATLVTGSGPGAATLSWTPGFDQAGAYGVALTARSEFGSPPVSLETTTTMYLQILDLDQAPLVTAPARVDSPEEQPIHVDVTVADPDGDVLTDLSAAPLPRGAVFSQAADHASGALDWTPDGTQAGTHRVTLTATSAHLAPGSSNPAFRQGSAEIAFEIADLPDRPPVVTAPAGTSGAEGAALVIDVTVTDPDGDEVTDLTAAPLPQGAVFAAGPMNAGASLAWTPDYDQAGAYTVTISATSVARASTVSAPVPLSASVEIAIEIANTDRAPGIAAPAGVTGPEGASLSFTATAADPDGEPVQSFAAAPLPLGATFVTNPANTTGVFEWTPTQSDAGSYPLTLTASNAMTGSATVVLTVLDVNRSPIADAGGPYAGFVAVPIQFDGTGSTDPDGTALAHRWDFGDLTTATGAAPLHAYAGIGTYDVTLIVSDGALEASAGTTASVLGVYEARAFTSGVDRTLRLTSDRPSGCVRLEPVGGGYANPAVDLASLALFSTGTGEVGSIPAVSGKSAIAGDADRNGIEEISACFAKEDLRRLFSLLPPGRHPVPVRIEATLLTGGRIFAELSLDVVASGAPLAASVTPNPSRGGATLTYRITRAGPVSVKVFDLAGRLVRVPGEAIASTPGYHTLRLATGAGLPSGIYYFRIDAAEGAATGRFVVLK